jgi:hypothetical protein
MNALSQLAKELGLETFAKVVVEIFTSPGRHGTKEGEELNPFDWKDNVFLSHIITNCAHRFSPSDPKAIYDQFFGFVDYLWESLPKQTKRHFLSMARDAIRLRARHLSVHNELMEAKQLMVLPLINFWAESWNQDKELAAQSFKDFCEYDYAGMLRFYSTYAGQPEAWYDALKRQLSSFKSGGNKQAKATRRRALRPGGVVYNTQRILNRSK